MSLNYLQPKPTKTMINDAAKLPTLTCNRLANKSEETKKSYRTQLLSHEEHFYGG